MPDHNSGTRAVTAEYDTRTGAGCVRILIIGLGDVAEVDEEIRGGKDLATSQAGLTGYCFLNGYIRR